MENANTKNRNTVHRLWLITVIILGSFFVFCIVTYLVTPLFMVHPVYDSEAARQLAHSDDIANVSLVSCGHTLSGYLLDRPQTDDLIVFFGGISDDSARIMLDLHNKEVYEHFALEYDIAVIDWPGYGASEGRATADSLRTAAADIVRFFSEEYEGPSEPGNADKPAAITDRSSGASRSGQLIIMAYSMGTGPAVYAARECGCDGLILISPYASSDDLYNSVINIFHGPMRSLLSYHMDTGEYAAGVSVIPLIAASQSDTRVPYDSSLRLAGCFPDGVCLETFDNISHGDMVSDPGVIEAVEQYLEDIR